MQFHWMTHSKAPREVSLANDLLRHPIELENRDLLNCKEEVCVLLDFSAFVRLGKP